MAINPATDLPVPFSELDDEALLTVKQLARHCSTTPNTVHSWIKSGRAPRATRPVPGGTVYFLVGDIRAWIRDGFEAVA